MLTLSCLASLGLWARSAWAHDAVYNDNVARDPSPGWTKVAFHSDGGALGVMVRSYFPPPTQNWVLPSESPPGWHWTAVPSEATFGGQDDRWLGIPIGYVAEDLNLRDLPGGPGRKIGRAYACWAPHWLVALATGAWPVTRFKRGWAERRARSRVGLCPVCGYDVRATPDRCPECGTEAAATPRV